MSPLSPLGSGSIPSLADKPLCSGMASNVLRVPTWPHHTSRGRQPSARDISTAHATYPPWGHVSLERAQRAEAAPGCYEQSRSSGSPTTTDFTWTRTYAVGVAARPRTNATTLSASHAAAPICRSATKPFLSRMNVAGIPRFLNCSGGSPVIR